MRKNVVEDEKEKSTEFIAIEKNSLRGNEQKSFLFNSIQFQRREKENSFGLERRRMTNESMPNYCFDPDAVLKENSNEIQWRTTKPDYSKVNLLFEKSKRTNHQPNSIEYLVQCLVKNWEKEASHKINSNQWLTINKDQYRFSCNGEEKYSADEMVEQGTYNALIGQTNYYDSKKISFEESHLIFKKCLSDGFAWEVLQVYSSPPDVTFTWRHFGPMRNSFHCRALSGQIYHSDATQQMIELFGMCKATVNRQFQIEDLQVFYDPNQLFVQLTQINPFAPFQTFSSREKEEKKNSLKCLSSEKKNELDRNEDLTRRRRRSEKSSSIQSKLCLLS